MSIHMEATLEGLAIEDGVSRFKKDIEQKEAKGILNFAQSKLFNQTFIEAEGIAKDILQSKGGPVQEWRELTKSLTFEQLAFITLQHMFHGAIVSAKRSLIYTQIAEDVINTLKLKVDNKEHFMKLGIHAYHSMCELPIFNEYENYSHKETIVYLTFSDDTLTELNELTDWQTYMKPFWRPMVSKPRSIVEGSYLESKLSSMLNPVRTFSKTQKKLLEPLMKPETPFVKACDAIQSVPLKINSWIVPIIEECYTRGLSIGSVPTNLLPNGTTVSRRLLRSQLKSLQAGFLADLEEAKHYQNYDEVYLPVTMDFRGRVYAKPYLNHQRADYIKALWLFVDGKQMDTIESVDWLKIHISNTGDFDKISKASFHARKEWVRANFDRIYQAVTEPFEDTWWTAADAPFSFLVACRELVNFADVGPEYWCHLPIAIDGSCSGLQHYSAMLRDPVGGKSVNLLPSNKPEDVYKDVAGIVNQLVIQDSSGDDPVAKEWLDHKIDRKVTKRATMTLCYGSKQYGWREQLMEDFMAKYKAQVDLGQLDKHPFDSPGKASGYMAKKLDIALRMTVEKALEGMEWLQQVAGLLAQEGHPVIWSSPLGFPVVNEYFGVIEKRLDLTINKRRVRPRLILGFTDKLKGSKQRSTIAPNFVHSYDASHLMMTVLEAKERGIDSFLLIHDSFGCLPSDMEEFSEIVKEQFVALYKHNDPFMAIYLYAMSVLSDKGKTKLTPPPNKGTLDLNEVLKSNYAFA
jgi:DNA-directed RNA polymerase, mitochondrial